MRNTALALLVLAACAPPGPQTCKLTDPKSCTNGTVCERVKGEGTPYCFQPVLLKGTVKVFGSMTPINNAEVTAVDVLGIPAGSVAKSDGNGDWSMRIETERSDTKGTPLFRTVKLRASAQDHAPFPSGVRTHLPIDMSAAKSEGDGKPYSLANSLTDLTLSALPDAEKGLPAVSGTVELGSTQPLVVLEGTKSYATSPDGTGAWKIFNVAPGAYKAKAYAKGLNYGSPDVTVPAGGPDVTGVAIAKNTNGTATLSGMVTLVAGANNAGTSVVVAVEATFIDALARGELVPGLRAPETGSPNVKGSYTIEGVPDGKYVVLAAFENDGNVRDPDPSIAGTQLARITVTNGTASSNPSFKVTGAVEVVGPGGGDTIEEVTGTPSFNWKAYPSAKTYELVVYSANGVKVWENLAVNDPPAAYNGPMLKAGVVYQWRVTAKDNAQNPISLTEDLKGLFSVK